MLSHVQTGQVSVASWCERGFYSAVFFLVQKNWRQKLAGIEHVLFQASFCRETRRWLDEIDWRSDFSKANNHFLEQETCVVWTCNLRKFSCTSFLVQLKITCARNLLVWTRLWATALLAVLDHCSWWLITIGVAYCHNVPCDVVQRWSKYTVASVAVYNRWSHHCQTSVAV